ncbi:HD domain-containing protein [Patescibacteria group bacterium]
MTAKQRLQKYLKEPRIKKLYNKVKKEFEKRGPISHNWDHIYRDIIHTIWIGEAEGADMDIVLPAIILHDIGFLYDPDPSNHHIVGAEKCLEWLDDWDEEEKAKISRCVRCHKGKSREFGDEPKTLEEKVVCDADLIEKYGMIGVLQGLRTLVEFGEISRPEFKSLYNIVKKFTFIEESRFDLYTKTANKIAKKRGMFLNDVFSKALKELEEYEN